MLMKNTRLREQRDYALFSAYRKALESKDFRSQKEAVEWTRRHGAPKFFVSPAVCAIFMSRIQKGTPLDGINILARKKFKELYRRFRKIADECPDMPILSICERIVDEPAPEFYISNDLCRRIINREIIARREEMAIRFKCK